MTIEYLDNGRFYHDCEDLEELEFIILRLALLGATITYVTLPWETK